MVSVLLLCWAFFSLLSPSMYYPLGQDSSLTDYTADNLEAHRFAETEIFVRSGFMRKLFNRRVQSTILRTSKGLVIYLRNQSRGCFSVQRVMNSKFICLDSKRKSDISVTNNNEDCRFPCIRRCEHFYMICSHRVHMWFRHQQIKPNITVNGSSNVSRFHSVERQEEHMPRRKRHNWHVDPSDPLGSEYPIVRTISDQRVESDHGSNVSKETITSVDDPLQVLLPHSPLSPTLEKDRKPQKFRF